MSVQSNPSDTGAVTPCPLTPAPAPPAVPPITVRGSIFFDGTGNNRANTSDRVRGVPSISRSLFSFTGYYGSYDNANTNVEKLERYIQTPNPDFSIYVEGIGTSNHEADSMLTGSATGMGPTGVKARVNRGLREFISFICAVVPDRTAPVTIHIDAFGFSRGAAAARYFAYQVLTHEDFFDNADGQDLRTQLTQNHNFTNIVEIQLKFFGLFDSVAAIGLDHSDNTNYLHLNAIQPASSKVHLVASNEHRLNFPLTDISQSGGIQFFLPGVHSDIGGGYQDHLDDENLIVYELPERGGSAASYQEALLREKTRLEQSGWFLASEITMNSHQLIVNRPNVRNQYSFIPLHIMLDHAIESGLTFTGNARRRNRIPRELNAIKGRIDAYMSSQTSGGGESMNDWNENDEVLQTLRHNFLHYSANYNSSLPMPPMRPQFYSAAHGWEDYISNRMNGTRTRRIYEG